MRLHVISCIFRRRQQSQKYDDVTTSTTMAPVHQLTDNQNDNHHEVITQFPSSAVGTEPAKHSAAASKAEYLDMSGTRLKNNSPRHPRPAAAGRPEMNPTELSSSKAQTENVTSSSSSSSGLYANIRKLSARLGRGKLRKPKNETRLYENVTRSSVYWNV